MYLKQKVWQVQPFERYKLFYLAQHPRSYGQAVWFQNQSLKNINFDTLISMELIKCIQMKQGVWWMEILKMYGLLHFVKYKIDTCSGTLEAIYTVNN